MASSGKRSGVKATDLYRGRDPRDVPAYALPIAAHYLNIPGGALKSWVYGTSWREPILLTESSESLSFWSLVEAFVLGAIRSTHGLPLPKIRRALRYIEVVLEIERPLIHQRFKTEGVDLFVARWRSLMNVSRGRETAIKKVLETHLDRIEFDEQGLAARLFPFVRDEARAIELDPRRAFGRPVLAGTSIPADVVRERFAAGESIAALSEDYRVPLELIEDAMHRTVTRPGRVARQTKRQ